ncbi:MAG: cation:proton antiporter, partial [Planctomycetota bacterium JB042]
TQTSPRGACLIAGSLDPRAEIAIIVMEEGRRLGPAVVPPELYAGMAVVVLGTCVLAPLAVGQFLRRPPRGPKAERTPPEHG